MSAPPGVQYMLDLSTAHLPGDNPDWGKLRVATHEYGWTVFVNDTPDESVEPEWIRPLMAYARTYCCMLINFDEAGDTVSFLPRWEW